MAKNIKELTEQRNNLLTQMDKLVNDATIKPGETRNLTQDENNKFDKLNSEIATIDEEIRELSDKGKKVEEREMADKQEMEVRSNLEGFIRGKNPEKRAQYVNTQEDGSTLIPENIWGEIMVSLSENAPVFAQSRKFPSLAGTLKIAKENTDDQAGFVGENEEVPSIRLKFGSVSLNQKRVGAAVTLTQQLLNDSGVDLLSYSSDLLARRAAKAIEKSIFKGEGQERGFVGVLSAEGLASEGLNKVELKATVTGDDLVDIINSVHPAYLQNAAFYMSRARFNAIAKLKDGNGDFLLQSGNINGKLGTKLLGFDIFVTEALEDKDGIIFGDFNAAYAIMVKKGFSLKHVSADTQQSLNGTQLLVLDGYMDGNIINAEALVVAQPKA